MFIKISKHLFAKLSVMTVLVSVTQFSQARPDTYINAKETVIAIGDLHGDFTAMLTILKAAQLIDENNSWIGGTKTLVQSR
ncbi:hypothetical protein [Shewanella surugensis]|uniref:Calcineurin-like phosphoesterase domain-containing protein n=1 Tax=Shewanella surugensis TaxID=212020 RepID=A0ABT0LCS5_9GAMM|nr:hypothetical protein [Shewanella surugensis]MCL1125506.1 hypothetical protein [Shewanella surugensis]